MTFDVEKARADGYSDAEIDAYLEGEEAAAPSGPTYKTGVGEAFLGGIKEGASLGVVPADATAREEHPFAVPFGELVGGMGPGGAVVGGLRKLASAIPAAGRMLAKPFVASSATGGILGAGYGAGGSDADAPGGVALDALTGAAEGAVIGPAIEAIPQAAGAIGRGVEKAGAWADETLNPVTRGRRLANLPPKRGLTDEPSDYISGGAALLGDPTTAAAVAGTAKFGGRAVENTGKAIKNLGDKLNALPEKWRGQFEGKQGSLKDAQTDFKMQQTDPEYRAASREATSTPGTEMPGRYREALESLKEQWQSPAHEIRPYVDPRIGDARDSLSSMAKTAGWDERGGMPVRNASDESVGRTAWAPQETWYKGLSEHMPGDEKGEATRELVRAALAGEPVSAKGKRVIGEMLDHLDAEKLDNAAFAKEKWSTLSIQQQEDELDQIFGESMANTGLPKGTPVPWETPHADDYHNTALTRSRALELMGRGKTSADEGLVDYLKSVGRPADEAGRDPFDVSFLRRTKGKKPGEEIGTERDMTAHLGINKYVTGEGMSYDPKAYDLINIWEPKNLTPEALGRAPGTEGKFPGQKGYRMISVEGISKLRPGSKRGMVTHHFTPRTRALKNLSQ